MKWFPGKWPRSRQDNCEGPTQKTPKKGRVKVRFTLPDGEVVKAEVGASGLMVGRVGGKADLELAGDEMLSRHHARLWTDDGDLWFEDVGSSNGSWRDGARLTDKVRLQEGESIVLGRTLLSLAQEKDDETGQMGEAPPPEMHLRMHAKAGRESFEEALQQKHFRYVSALAEFVQELLGSTGRLPIFATLSRLNQVIPTAQRFSLVEWPPNPEGEFTLMVDQAELEQAGIEVGPVSRSLARLAVERGEALLFSEEHQELAAARESALMHGIRSAVYVPLCSPDEEIFGVLCVDSPMIPLDQGEFQLVRAVGGLLATALNTEKLREQARQKELEARQNLARREALANFLNIASHDLKSPLTVVRGCSRLIEQVQDLDQIRQLSGKILDASLRAESLIASYLEVAEITTGQALVLEKERFGLAQLVDEEIEFQRQAAGDLSHQPSVVNEVPPEMLVEADRKKVAQVLSNLISNAIKYTLKKGQVRIEARLQGEEALIEIHDQGVGISPEDQARLFKKFQRVGDRSLVPGTGLGLWLVAELVHAHGGSIGVESEPGVGSCFSFTLP